MDKAEYQEKLDELTICVEDGDYEAALPIVEAIDWRRVKSVKTLSMVADVYEKNQNYEKMRNILMIAQTRTSIGRGVLSRLVDVCLRLGDVDQAEKYYHEFAKVAQNDTTKYVLQYKLYKAKGAPLENQIAVLEEYREKEYTERWAYELAVLYSKAGEEKKCVEACDDLILWFNEGKYVLKAMELKKQYEPLTPSQEVLYARERDAEARRLREAAAAKAAEEAAKKAAEEARIAEEEAARKAAEEAAAKEAAEEEARKQAEAEGENVFPEPTPTDEQKEVVFRFESEIEEPEEKQQEESAPAEEPVTEQPAKEAAAEKKEKKEPAESSGGRLFKSFQNMFGKHADKAQPEAAAAEPVEAAEAAETEEPDEKDLKIRELPSGVVEPEAEPDVEPEAIPVPAPEETAGEEETVSDAVPVYEEEPEKEEVEFDLDGFLREMKESISEEITSGDYKAREVAPLPEEIPEPEEETPLTGTQGLLEAMMAAEASESAPEIVVAPAAGTEAADSGDHITAEESIQAAVMNTVPPEVVQKAAEEVASRAEKKKPKYNEELEIPDEEPTEEEKKAHTIPLGTIGQNTVPISIDKILSQETAEEQRIRILNKARPSRMSEEQRQTFTYFARIPGMDAQILEAISSVYEHAGERTSLHGNIGVMGAKGTGKSRLSTGLIVTMCKDMGIDAAKVARITGDDLNKKDPVRIVNLMAGGFLTIEDVSHINEPTLAKLNQAMEFRTDCMIVIIEDEKTAMRAFLKDNPTFAAKFEKMISIPVFTNDELVTFARTYAAENDCQLDDLAILALYTKIGNMQSEENPITISVVRDMVDKAIRSASGKRRSKRGGRKGGETSRLTILHEKDFDF